MTPFVLIFLSATAAFSAQFETRQACENALYRLRNDAGLVRAPATFKQPTAFCAPVR